MKTHPLMKQSIAYNSCKICLANQETVIESISLIIFLLKTIPYHLATIIQLKLVVYHLATKYTTH